MISKKYYQELLSPIAFKRDRTKTEQDLFYYVVESEINGNYSQVREFIKKMSKKQHNDFLNFLSFENDLEIKGVFLK